MMRKLFVVFVLLVSVRSHAQLSRSDARSLRLLEDTMKTYASDMIFNPLAEERFKADSIFIRMLVRAFRTPYSFDYSFDSIQTVSKLYPPDSSFRIFTWQFERDESYYRQYGVIQMRTKDGALKIFPLIDASNFAVNPVDSVRSNTNWIGAIYYAIVEKKFNDKNYYSLLGYDDNDFTSTKKWIDVLTFNNTGEPQFGGRYFTYNDDSLKPAQPAYRFCLEYKKDARARMNYDPEMDMIIFDHLVSETNKTNQKFTLIPDGDYEGFKWQNGKWIHVDKVFNFKLENGQFPMPEPIKDDAGKSDEIKLMQQSQKNMQKKPKKN